MDDNIEFTLELQGKGDKLTIPCGNISRVETAIHNYGFEGNVQFWLDQKQIEFLYKLPVIDITLTILSHSSPDDVKPIELKGIVTRKTLVSEHANQDTAGLKVLSRIFKIEFKDPLQVIWSKHFPVAIFTEKKLEDVINEYLPSSAKIKIESESFKEERPLIALGLGYKENKANFYSFLMWHLDQIDAVWEYDYKEHQYVIRDKKDDAPQPIDLPYDEGAIFVDFPEPSRRDSRIFNSYADDPSIKKVPGEEVFEKIMYDILVATPLKKEVDLAEQKAQPRPNAFDHRLELFLESFPTVEFAPGNLFTFKQPQWSEDLFYKQNTYRLVSLRLDLKASNFEFSEVGENPSQGYTGTAQASFETKEEPDIHRPSFTAPCYPFPLEGKVFSDVGEQKDLTFDIEEDEETKQKTYTVELPCAEMQHVKAPFEPTYTNGQIYNPLLRGQRVVVVFELFTAKIVSVLEWLPSAELPIKTEGNRIVFAPKKDDNAYTVLQHFDEEGHLVFYIQRKSDPQIQMLRIEEDGFHIIVKKDEEKDPQCHLWLNNEHTIEITSEDKQAKQKQMVKLEPEKITVLCEKGGDKSTFTQTPKSTTIETQELVIKTEKTNLTSKEATTCKGKKVSIEGSQGVDIKDGASVKINGKTVDVKGSTTNIKGSTVNIG